MENKSNVNLAAIDSAYYNETMRYRINGFAEACGMKDIEFVPNSCEAIKKDEEGREIYNITSEHINGSIVRFYNIIGHYYNLCFSFANVLRPGDQELLNKKNHYLKFIVLLDRFIDECEYKLTIHPYYFHYVIQFERINESRGITDNAMLNAHIRDIDKLFKIIKLYQANPPQFFELFCKNVSEKGLCPGNIVFNRMINNYQIYDIKDDNDKVFKKSK